MRWYRDEQQYENCQDQAREAMDHGVREYARISA